MFVLPQFFCGVDASAGCLGHGDWQSLAAPKLIESLLTVDVSAIECGPEHVVVVGNQGDVYAWGRGSKGRLPSHPAFHSASDFTNLKKIELINGLHSIQVHTLVHHFPQRTTPVKGL